MTSMITSFPQLCATLAPIASIVNLASPAPTVYRIHRQESTQSLPLLPYTSMIANCLLWAVYGVLKKDISIWGTNGVGLIMGVIYSTVFVKYCNSDINKGSKSSTNIARHRNGLIAILLYTALLYSHGSPSSTELLGNTAVVFCLILFASPLSVLRNVIKTQSAHSIPTPFAVATLINCILWSITGLYVMHDNNIVVPNVTGSLLALTQLLVKMWFGCRGTHSSKKRDEKKGGKRMGSTANEIV